MKPCWLVDTTVAAKARAVAELRERLAALVVSCPDDALLDAVRVVVRLAER